MVLIIYLSVGGVDAACGDSVRDLGIWMDSSLSFDLHITKKCQIARHQLDNLAEIRNHLSQKSTEIIIHGLVHSHLDFCNSLFADLPSCEINRFQRVQNWAARIMTRMLRAAPAEPILRSLH